MSAPAVTDLQLRKTAFAFPTAQLALPLLPMVRLIYFPFFSIVASREELRLGHGSRMGERHRVVAMGTGYAIVVVVVEVCDFLFGSTHNKVIVF